MRPTSLTDQILIKAKRIRSLEIKGEAFVEEDIPSGYIAIINYCIIGMIQLELGHSEQPDLSAERAIQLYDKYAEEALELMKAKNHDYDEAWRMMRVSSYTDLILTKLQRTREIEDNDGKTLVSEGIGANYMDMLNYSVFALIKLTIENQ